MIINLVLFFIPKRQEIYRLYLIKKRKKLACMRLNSKTFQYIDSVILDQALKTESILYTTNVKQLYISYGLKNKTQSYGGSTIIIFALEDKPCMVPVYIQNGTLIAHLYIHNNPNKHTVDFYCYLCNESIIVNLYCLK